MSKITPCIWSDFQADEAIEFYLSIFPDSRLIEASRYRESGPGPAGQILMAVIELDGNEFQILNGGPSYKPTPGISFSIPCETQQQIDHYWNNLGKGGHYSQCGWLSDKFGVSWQVVPTILGKYLNDKDEEKAGRVIHAMMGMEKFIIADLDKAYKG